NSIMTYRVGMNNVSQVSYFDEGEEVNKETGKRFKSVDFTKLEEVLDKYSYENLPEKDYSVRTYDKFIIVKENAENVLEMSDRQSSVDKSVSELELAVSKLVNVVEL